MVDHIHNVGPVLQSFCDDIQAATKNIPDFKIELTCLSLNLGIMPKHLDIKYLFQL